MKIAVSGDIHTHEFTDYSTTKTVQWDNSELCFVESDTGITANSRLLDILNTLIQAREYCLDNNISVFVIAGDLFHKRGAVSTIVYNMTYLVVESFKIVGITLIILAGNHDQVSNEDKPQNSLFALNKIAIIVSECGELVLNREVRLLMIPFSKNKELVLNPIENFEPDDIPTVLVSHLGINGAYVGKTSYACKDMFSLADLQPEKFKYIVLGHYHKPQLLDYNALYTGSPIQHNFNDEGEDRGFWVIDTDRRYDMRLIPLKSPKFMTIMGEIPSDVDIENNFVKVIASSENVDKIVEAIGDSTVKLEIQKDYQEETRSGVSITQSYEEIIMIYAKENMPEAEDVGLEIYRDTMC